MLDQILSQLKAREPFEPLPPLFPTKVWDASLSREIQSIPNLSDSVRAGLLLWNDDLEASHGISQGIHSSTGSFWHAIMHRREGDVSNALYWWRRVGVHEAFGDIYEQVLSVLQQEKANAARNFATALQRAGTWKPDDYTHQCAKATSDDVWLRRVQVVEIDTLLRWCMEHDE